MYEVINRNDNIPSSQLFLSESKIVTNENDRLLLKEWINKNYESAVQIYLGSRDGFKKDSF